MAEEALAPPSVGVGCEESVTDIVTVPPPAPLSCCWAGGVLAGAGGGVDGSGGGVLAGVDVGVLLGADDAEEEPLPLALLLPLAVSEEDAELVLLVGVAEGVLLGVCKTWIHLCSLFQITFGPFFAFLGLPIFML